MIIPGLESKPLSGLASTPGKLGSAPFRFRAPSDEFMLRPGDLLSLELTIPDLRTEFMLLHGIFPPITTPFYPDGKVYFKKLEHNVERYSKTPVAGIVVLGSTGEAIMLSDEERREVLKVARDVAAPTKVMVAGTGIESAIETLRLTEYAAGLDYHVALVRTPHFYKKGMLPANLLAFYRTVADRSPLPVMIYNVPGFTGYDIPAEVVVELAYHPNIIGMKESGGDAEKIRRMVEGTRQVRRSATVTETFEAVTPGMLNASTSGNGRGGELVQVAALGDTKPSSSAVSLVSGRKTRQMEVGFQIVVGLAQKLEVSLQAGAVGGILAFADAAPTACYEIYAAWKEGDAELARLKQDRILKATLRISGELGIPGLKYGMDLNGYFGGLARLPLLPLTAALKNEVEQLLADVRN
jgi:4-hydroxy-2-oxoglutarate aldolase